MKRKKQTKTSTRKIIWVDYDTAAKIARISGDEDRTQGVIVKRAVEAYERANGNGEEK